MAGETWGSKTALREARADDWLSSAQQSTEEFLRGMGWSGSQPKQQDAPPPLDIRLPTAEEYHATAPWRDLDPVKPVASRASTTPSVTGDAYTRPASTGAAAAGGSRGDPSGGVEQWNDIVQEAARTYGVDPADIKGLMHIESGGRADAVSSAGALGLMQTMPFHYQPGEDGMDPRTNIMRGAKIYADNLRRYGDRDRAAAAYFGAIDGQGNVTSATDGSSVDGHEYVRLFRDAAARYQGTPNAGAAQPSAPAATPSTPDQTAGSSPSGAGASSLQGSGPIRVRDPWGNEWNTTQEALNRRPGGYADLTILPSMQKTGADLPESDGQSAGDQKRARLAAMRGEPQPMPSVPAPILPIPGGAAYDFANEPAPHPQRAIVEYNPETGETGDPLNTAGWWLNGDQPSGDPVQYRQPLVPTMGADTATGEYVDPDSGPRELGYSVPADPATYGGNGDEQGQAPYTGDGVVRPSGGSPIISDSAPSEMTAPASPSPADDPGGMGFAAQDAYSTPAPQQPYSPYGEPRDPTARLAPNDAPNAPTSTQVPVWDESGENVVGYRHVAPAGRQAIGAPPVQSTVGEPDYVSSPRGLLSALEPMGGMDRMSERMRQIEDNAARELGVQHDPIASMRAPSNPQWRAANPEAASEYDDLSTQYAMTVAGQVGDGARMGDEAARAARIAREQRITSDYGRKYPDVRGPINTGTERALGEPSAEMLADSRFPRDAVHPDIRADVSAPITDPPSTYGRQNAALPLDPTGAALGAGAGAATEDEDGQQADPWRTATGLVIGGILGKKGLNAAEKKAWGEAIKKAEARGGKVADDLIEHAEHYDPRLAQEPVLPGFEPPRTSVSLPETVGDAAAQAEMRAAGSALPGMEDLAADRFDPARARVPGATPGQARKAQGEMRQRGSYLPELDDPLRPVGPTREIPESERVAVPTNTIDEASPGIIRSLDEKPVSVRGAANGQAEMRASGAAALPTMEEHRGLVQRISDVVSPWANRVNIVRYAGMLSDTATQLTNAAGGVGSALADIATTPIAATLDAARVGTARAIGGPVGRKLGTEREVFFSEVPARLRGMRAGASIGLRDALDIMRSGVREQDAAKLDKATEGFNSGNKVVDFAFEAPLRALAAADAVFRTMAGGGHLMAEATAAATRANGGKAPTPEMIREAAKDPRLLERVRYLAARSVLQEDRTLTNWYKAAMRYKPESGAGQAAMSAAQAAASVEIPYVKTPYNVVAQGVGMTPAGLLGVIQDMAEHKAPREIEQRVARVALGTALMAGAASSYAAGNLTGPRPTDPKEASTLPPGWQPWSRKWQLPDGTTFYQPLAAEGPFAVPSVVAILAGEAQKKGKAALSPDWAGQVAMGLGRYAEQATFFEGVANISKMFDERTGEKNVERNAEQIAAQFSPHVIGGGALGREIQRVMGMPMRDPAGAIEAILATHPATAGQVEPRQDTLGRPVVQMGQNPAVRAASTIVRGSVENDASVIRAFRRAGEGLPMAPPKSIRDPESERMRVLTPAQQQRWRRVFGAALNEGYTSEGRPSDAETLRKVESTARGTANDAVLGRR